MQLVIVESPSKSQIIKKYLNESAELESIGQFEVIASFGHIRDLPKRCNISKSNSFEVEYHVLDEKKKYIAHIRDSIKKAEHVWIATDNDREGEAIGWHIVDYFKVPKKKYSRIVFREITPCALVNAVLSPSQLNIDMVMSQQARRVIDRLVGFEITGNMWKYFRSSTNSKSLSSGRVQAAVLDIVVSKEKEKQLVDQTMGSYWNMVVDVRLPGDNPDVDKVLPGRFLSCDLVDREMKQIAITLENELDGYFDNLISTMVAHEMKTTLNHFKTKESVSAPPDAYKTTTLQQDAFNKLGYPVAKTMKYAQDLYEKGYITYMRSDSTKLSETFKQKALLFIGNKFGEHFISADSSGASESKSKSTSKSKANAKKSKFTQEAHEAIRPTTIIRPCDIKDMDATLVPLYEMIYKRSIASLMTGSVSIVLELVMSLKDSKEPFYFRGSIEFLKIIGWKAMYCPDTTGPHGGFRGLSTYTEESVKNIAISIGYQDIPATSIKTSHKFTRGLPRYNEATLVQKMEKEGIGRPSTYSNILDKLFAKNYIDKCDIKLPDKRVKNFVFRADDLVKEVSEEVQTDRCEKNKISPTKSGEVVNEYINKYYPIFADVKFTCDMEEQLDLIVQKKATYMTTVDSVNSVLEDISSKIEESLSRHVEHDSTVVVKLNEASDRFHDFGQTRTMTINGDTVNIKQARYGPVIQVKNKFISLIPYLKLTRKGLNEIDESDVRLLVSFPKAIAHKDIVGDAKICYGRYGFYLQDGENKNIKLKKTKNMMQVIMLEDYDSLKTIGAGTGATSPSS